MSYILDILGCATICLTEVIAIVIIGMLIQGITYRLTKFSIYNFIKDTIKKEMQPDWKHLKVKNV